MLERLLDLSAKAATTAAAVRSKPNARKLAPITASHTDASTRSVITVAGIRLASGAEARRRAWHAESLGATSAHEAPETACARIFVSRPAP